MKKSYAILEIKNVLAKHTKAFDKGNISRLYTNEEIATYLAQHSFDDLETIFKIYLKSDAHNDLRVDLEAANSKIKELEVHIEEAEDSARRFKAIPQEIIHTHKFDKASRNAIVLAGYMSGRNGVGYSIINQGELNNDILKDAIE